MKYIKISIVESLDNIQKFKFNNISSHFHIKKIKIKMKEQILIKVYLSMFKRKNKIEYITIENPDKKEVVFKEKIQIL